MLYLLPYILTQNHRESNTIVFQICIHDDYKADLLPRHKNSMILETFDQVIMSMIKRITSFTTGKHCIIRISDNNLKQQTYTGVNCKTYDTCICIFCNVVCVVEDF